MHAVEQSFNAAVQSSVRTKHQENLTCMLYVEGVAYLLLIQM